jgi:ubiquinone/menaquinone biosynthesis C-methylase UbiE
MLKQMMHRLIANPKAYDIVQYLAGVRILHDGLKMQLAQLDQTNSVVLDIGGGTGLLKGLCHPNQTYFCLDIDPNKLKGFRIKYLDGNAIIADGTCLPFPNESIDIILCAFVTHHLDEESLRKLISETARVVRPTGRMLILDPVWVPSRLPGVFLWKYDQGSFPRTESDLNNFILKYFEITTIERLAIFHEYALYVAAKRSSGIL